MDKTYNHIGMLPFILVVITGNCLLTDPDTLCLMQREMMDHSEYRPECSSDGLFELVQCYGSDKSMCHCVDIYTGEALRGAWKMATDSVTKASINCSGSGEYTYWLNRQLESKRPSNKVVFTIGLYSIRSWVWSDFQSIRLYIKDQRYSNRPFRVH